MARSVADGCAASSVLAGEPPETVPDEQARRAMRWGASVSRTAAPPSATATRGRGGVGDDSRPGPLP